MNQIIPANPESFRLNQPCPLSFPQERMWNQERESLSAESKCLPTLFRISGPLDRPVLSRCFSELARRHEILRTTFRLLDGTPAQIVSPNLTPHLKEIDLRSRGTYAREREAQRLIDDELHQPFDLAKGPLMRASLLRMTDEEFALLINQHHMITDAWSLAIFARELSTLYNAFVDGDESPLPEMKLQYGDYALWQKNRMRAGELDDQIAYWQRQLRGVVSPELRTDRPRTDELVGPESFTSTIYTKALSDKLRHLAQQQGATTFMLLACTLSILLHSYTGLMDIALRTGSTNRKPKELEGLLGWFVSTLIIRVNVWGDPTFRELLGQVRGVVLDAIDHQDIGFDAVMNSMGPESDVPGPSPFQVSVMMQNAPQHPIELRHLLLEPRSVGQDSRTRRELLIELFDDGQEIRSRVKYRSDLFDYTTIAAMASRFEVLLESIVSDPNQHISRLCSLIVK